MLPCPAYVARQCTGNHKDSCGEGRCKHDYLLFRYKPSGPPSSPRLLVPVVATEDGFSFRVFLGILETPNIQGKLSDRGQIALLLGG